MAIFPAAISSAGSAGGGAFYDYSIDQSLRFQTSYFNRTPSSAGNRRTFTISWWMKGGNDISDTVVFSAGTDGSNWFEFKWNNGFELSYRPGSYQSQVYTTPKYRDCSAWYHVVVAIDTTQSTASNRVKLYVNGEQVTALNYSVYPSQNTELPWNGANEHSIGYQLNGGEYFNGYMAEFHSVDGQQLEPTSFGEFKSGTWKPIEYTGSYGTNGFYLDFGNSSSIGDDVSGNNNDWTPSGGVQAYDIMLDSPTNNFPNWNRLSNSQGASLVEGNLKATAPGAVDKRVHCTHGMSSGKWYWEVSLATRGNRNGLGIFSEEDTVSTSIPTHYAYLQVGNNGSYTSGTNNYSTPSFNSGGDILTFAFDADAGAIWYGRNAAPTVSGSGHHYGLDTSVTYLMGYLETGSDVATNIINFGQDSSFVGTKTAQGNTDDNGYGDFYYAPPSGYLALCTANLPDPVASIDPAQDGSPQDHFNTVLYTGNGTSQDITGVGFTPDLVWHKGRSVAYYHSLVDSIRGDSNVIFPNDTIAEQNPGDQLDIITDGFTTTYRSANNANNQSSQTYVAWNWKANGSGVSNTDGSITSTVSANTDAGFAIVDYNGGGNGSTMGHGLGAVPACIIVKKRDSDSPGNARGWSVYHKSLATDKALLLESTSAQLSEPNWFREDLMSTSVFGVNGDYNTGYSGDDYIAYVWAEVDGFSKFGSYVGNGSTNGPFVYTGFSPAFVVVKNVSTGASYTSWFVHDNKRPGYNENKNFITANTTSSEDSSVSRMDMTANGFKIITSAGGYNTSGDTYIYMAFAENPFKYANAR